LTLQYFNPLPNNYMDIGLIPYTQKFTLYNHLRYVASLLSQIKAAIIQYNNVIIGAGNTVVGDGNVVIGSNDTVVGNSNWILSSNYTSQDAEDGVLVVGNYMIELYHYYEVLQNPSFVINCVNTQDAARLVNAFWTGSSATRRYIFTN
jgi:hypothetical protein